MSELVIRKYGYVLFFGLITFQSIAQDGPAPEYLTKQSFPDSVLQTKLYTLDGGLVSFSDVLKKYQGKKVMLDFWATWCKDCIVSLPKYRQLLKEADGQKIEFVLLSVDKEESRWKAGIKKFKIEGNHYRFTSGWKNPLTNYIDLDWIPRYVVLDEQGMIIEPKTILLDDEKLTKVLFN